MFNLMVARGNYNPGRNINPVCLSQQTGLLIDWDGDSHSVKAAPA
jgi:hypothetical protein